MVAAPRKEVWALVGDPYHHPRWWPRVQRVEGVTARGWTNVLVSSRGNTVRTDWVVEVNEEPTRRRWAQEIDGTPFERLFKRNAIEAQLDHAESGFTRGDARPSTRSHAGWRDCCRSSSSARWPSSSTKR